MGRAMIWWGAVLMGLYVFYGVVMVWLHPRFIYPFSDRPFDAPGFVAAQVEAPQTPDLPVQVARGAPGAPVVVYFMGNVGALEFYEAMLAHHAAQGRSVVAMTYRGGGGTPGAPSEGRLRADAEALMAALPGLVPEAGPVVVQGYSLGSGLALHVAARPEVAGVVLSAPYARMCRLMARAAYLPACQMPGVQAWRSVDRAEGIAAPILILHGSRDTLIPPKESTILADGLRAKGMAVTREVIEGGGHADLFGTPGYLEAIDAFVEAQR